MQTIKAIIELLEKTSDEDYPALRENIIDYGELTELDRPYNPIELGIRANGLDPKTISRQELRCHLVMILQQSYVYSLIRHGKVNCDT